MNRSKRIVFGSGEHGGHSLIPEILEIGWGHFANADSGHLRRHKHQGAFEICLLVSGEVEWFAGDTGYVLRGGDVFVTRPDEVHWGRDAAMHPCTLYWLIAASPRSGVSWLHIDAELADYLDNGLYRQHSHRLRGTSALRSTFEELFREHHAAPSAD